METLENARGHGGQVNMSSEQVRMPWTMLSLMAPLLVLAIVYLLLSRLMAQ